MTKKPGWQHHMETGREGPGMKNEGKSEFEVGIAVLLNTEAITIFESWSAF